MSDSVVTFPDLAEESEQLRIVERDASPEQRMAMLEAVIFAAEDPPTVEQLATAPEHSPRNCAVGHRFALRVLRCRGSGRGDPSCWGRLPDVHEATAP